MDIDVGSKSRQDGLLAPIPSPDLEEIHHFPRSTTASSVIGVCRSIPVVCLLLVCLCELAIVLDQDATPANLPTLPL